jgi:antitoxin component of MazEF toxin-antitoxin module
MGKISQVKSQDDFPVTIRKLMRLGHGYAVTLPPAWVRSLNPADTHYLTVHVSHDGSVIVRSLSSPTVPRDVQADPNCFPGP